MAPEASSFIRSYAIVAVMLFAGSIGYFFIRLDYARMLLVERQRRGLVSYQIPCSHTELTICSPWPLFIASCSAISST